jgi:small subunit ribosomal protein S21
VAIAYSKPDEDIEKVLRRFKRQVKEENILQEVRDREAYEKPSVLRKAEQKERERNNQRRMRLEDQ